jgi:hypothetical protein
LDRIELWNPEDWERMIGPSEDLLADPDLGLAAPTLSVLSTPEE